MVLVTPMFTPRRPFLSPPIHHNTLSCIALPQRGTPVTPYWDGVDCDDNPLISETDQHHSWDEGWSQAQLEDDKADGA